ncbi:MAG: cytochrome c biogenesis protein CcsA [Myxococcota bacterium]|nr:cytochrome c biogenesis protein CcsA [Myxococcota bacterium]
MALVLHQLTTAAYLAASLAAGLALGLRAPRFNRIALGLLIAGFCLHTGAFLQLHQLDPTPALTELPLTLSLVGWIGTAAYLAVLLRVHGAALVVAVAPLAFGGAFFAAVALPGAEPPDPATSPLWSHLHIVLASAGLSLLGLAGTAGLLYVIHHRFLKSKSPNQLRLPLPSLEALDRVNAIALAIGFVVLSLGLLSGIAWVYAAEGRLWPGTPHANATLAAWVVYAGVSVLRWRSGFGSRQSALSSAVGFAVLLVAVVGVGVLA